MVREGHDMPGYELLTDAWPGPLEAPPCDHPRIPDYLEHHYRWAYLDPFNAWLLDRRAVVESILFGHYRRLSNAALRALEPAPGRRLQQLGCVYGDLTPRLARLLSSGDLEVVDAAPLQIARLRRKLPPSDRSVLHCRDATLPGTGKGRFDAVLLFFLLHELPEDCQRRALAEALRVCRPGGRVVVVDYARPHALHPLRWLLPPLFHWLEPFVTAFWSKPIESLLPPDNRVRIESTRRWFGGLYRMVTLSC
jgi:ubiquinone/menaquinone biosynthesis C-methylase UbiE